MTELKLDNYDPLQAQLMEERVILVDGNDQVIGSESKKNSMKIPSGTQSQYNPLSSRPFNGEH